MPEYLGGPALCAICKATLLEEPGEWEIGTDYEHGDKPFARRWFTGTCPTDSNHPVRYILRKVV